jgi:hypothetical protein
MADREPGSGPIATAADWEGCLQAIELSRCCPPSASAFCVGAVIVAADGDIIATGFRGSVTRMTMRRRGPGHRGTGDPRLPGAALPARRNRAKPAQRPALALCRAGHRGCSAAGGDRLAGALGLRPGRGAGVARSSGVTVVEIPELAAEARRSTRLCWVACWVAGAGGWRHLAKRRRPAFRRPGLPAALRTGAQLDVPAIWGSWRAALAHRRELADGLLSPQRLWPHPPASATASRSIWSVSGPMTQGRGRGW